MKIILTYHEKTHKQLTRFIADPLNVKEKNQLTELAADCWNNNVRHEFFPESQEKFIPATILDVYVDEVHKGLTT